MKTLMLILISFGCAYASASEIILSQGESQTFNSNTEITVRCDGVRNEIRTVSTFCQCQNVNGHTFLKLISVRSDNTRSEANISKEPIFGYSFSPDCDEDMKTHRACR